uniref:Checkpoint protein n=3 Tax=Ascarididae TaxID=6250 RepID=A0A915BIX6_PARUN
LVNISVAYREVTSLIFEMGITFFSEFPLSNFSGSWQAEMVSSTEEQLSECREVFCYFDSKGDERIGVAQVGDVLRALGQNPTDAEIRKCCAHWTDPDTRITFEDFVPIYQSVNKSKESHTLEEFVEGLSHFDKEGNGLINVAELRHLLTTLGERLSDEEVDQLLAGHDDSHGNVNISDFVRAVMHA